MSQSRPVPSRPAGAFRRPAMRNSPAVFDIPYSDPLAAFAPFAAEPFSLLLDSAAPDRGRYSYLCVRPRHLLTAGVTDTVDPFARVAQALGAVRPVLPDLPPFQGGAAGYFSYELAHHVERLPRHQPDDLGLPAMAVGLFDAVAAWDHEKRAAWVIGTAETTAPLAATLRTIAPLSAVDWSVRSRFAPDLDGEDYRRRIRRVIDDIFAGDIFQANLSQRFRAPLPSGLDPFMLYRRLRQLAPAPFSAFLRLGEAALLSVSPERFLRVYPDGQVETRPIKGTRPRGGTPEEDDRLAAALLDSAKDRAENLMIVDLLRNDLSRVCIPGTVVVPELCVLERFAAVLHLVSSVEGRLGPGVGPLDLLKAAFPGGSVTGAPKVRAMEIIAELEPVRRGPYCGAIGWIGWDGAMDTSIAIRTMTLANGVVHAQAGGGITADSDPDAEYEETLVKARAMLASLEGYP